MKVILLLTLLLSGCATYGGLSADQIAAAVKDRQASAVCVSAVGNAGQIRVVVINADKGVVPPGTTVHIAADTCNADVGYVKAP